MGILTVILLIVFVIACLLLIAMVLLQDEQGEGLGGLFGGGSATPFGSRSGNVLTKFTSILAAVFIIVSLGLAWVNRTPEKGDVLGAAYRDKAENNAVTEWWSDSDAEKTE